MSDDAVEPTLQPDQLKAELLARTVRRQRSLEKTYEKSSPIGLVLGAGVTAAHIPTYDEFVLRLLEDILRARNATGGWQEAFVEQQRNRLHAGSSTVPPDIVAALARLQWASDEPIPLELVELALWGRAREVGVVTDPEASRSYARKDAWAKNDTLNAVITLCTCLEAGEPVANENVGAVLTTNYDNLLEAAAHGKYRTHRLFKPVARTMSAAQEGGERQIPVVHIHGYANFRKRRRDAAKPLVMEERDYFEFSYAPLGFGSYMTMAFLQRYPTVFIGSRLTDMNLRRLLHQIARDSESGELPHAAYALMKLGDEPQDHVLDMVTDLVLADYGVRVIWIEEFAEIRDVLRMTYTGGDDARATMWDHLWSYSAYTTRGRS